MFKGQWPVQRYTITLFLFAGVDKYANHIISFVSKRTTQRSRTAWFTCVHTKYNILRPMFVVYSRELYNSRLPVQIQQIVYNSMRLCAQRGTLLSGRNHQWPSTARGPSKFHIHIIYTTTPLFAEQQTTKPKYRPCVWCKALRSTSPSPASWPISHREHAGVYMYMWSVHFPHVCIIVNFKSTWALHRIEHRSRRSVGRHAAHRDWFYIGEVEWLVAIRLSYKSRTRTSGVRHWAFTDNQHNADHISLWWQRLRYARLAANAPSPPFSRWMVEQMRTPTAAAARLSRMLSLSIEIDGDGHPGTRAELARNSHRFP